MATTVSKITEQVSRLYARYLDREDINPILDKREVKLLIEQAINKVLNARVFEGMREGYVDVPRSSLVLYEDQSVSTDDYGAYVTLPAIPISLVNDVGVYEVRTPSVDYIPLPRQSFVINKANVLGNLDTNIGYYVEGKKIRFSKDITNAAYGSVSEVDIVLLVSDLSQVTDNEILPLPAEYEEMVIGMVLEQISKGAISQQELNADHNVRQDRKGSTPGA